MQKALSYRFRLRDLPKYSQKLKLNDVKWNFKRSALGKIIPSDNERLVRLHQASFLTKL